MAKSELSTAPDAVAPAPGWAVRGTRFLIRGYQLVISPLLGPKCRHLPTCSDYALEAVTRFGALRGGWLAFRRIIRCNPWGTSGYDPVPEARRRS